MDSERDGLSDLASDIRATAENLVVDANRVAVIEQAKATLPVTDERLPALAEESEKLTARMAQAAKMETALVREAQPQSD